MNRPPTHPGEVLQKEYFDHFGYGSQAEAARRMGITTVRLNEICCMKRAVSPDTAVLLARLTETSAEMWLHMQANRDIWFAQRKNKRKVIPLVKPL